MTSTQLHDETFLSSADKNLRLALASFTTKAERVAFLQEFHHRVANDDWEWIANMVERRPEGTVGIKEFIEGPEYTVAVLGERALPSIRLETDNEFYDYEAKYVSDDTRYLLPSGLSASEEAEIAALSLRAFQSVGCSVWGRVDLMRDAQGDFYVLEVNTVPGMTSHSLVPMAAAAAGLEIPALVREIVELSLEENQ